MKHLILGGARSGKSTFAEQQAKELASEHDLRLIYVATSTVGDEEMAGRIAQHQSRRGSEWELIEEPIELADVLRRHAQTDVCILVDCLTLWLSNCLHKGCWLEERDKFIEQLDQSNGHVLLVSNEVGSGVVPLGQLSREFVDHSGWLHQGLAKVCDRATLVVAGLPMQLKS